MVGQGIVVTSVQHKTLFYGQCLLGISPCTVRDSPGAASQSRALSTYRPSFLLSFHRWQFKGPPLLLLFCLPFIFLRPQSLISVSLLTSPWHLGFRRSNTNITPQIQGNVHQHLCSNLCQNFEFCISFQIITYGSIVSF